MAPARFRERLCRIGLLIAGESRATLKFQLIRTNALNDDCEGRFNSVIKAQTLFTDMGPDTQMIQILVTMRSGALNCASIRSSHDWLQAEADAKAKAAHDAAAQRTGTIF